MTCAYLVKYTRCVQVVHAYYLKRIVQLMSFSLETHRERRPSILLRPYVVHQILGNADQHQTSVLKLLFQFQPSLGANQSRVSSNSGAL